MEKTIPVMDKTLAMLQPVVYWIANTSELYHHIHRLSIQLGEYVLYLICVLFCCVFKGFQDQSIQEALTVLSNSIVYAFQQSFFPVGKVRLSTHMSTYSYIMHKHYHCIAHMQSSYCLAAI